MPATWGHVQYTDGTPVADLASAIDHDPPLRVRTDRAGDFAVILADFSDEGKAGLFPSIPGVDPEGTGLDGTAPTLAITVSAHRLRIRLPDDHGEPLHGQEVPLRLGRSHERSVDVEGVTDERGEVSLFAAPGATGRLRMVRAGNAPLIQTVEVPETGNGSVLVVDVPDRTSSGGLLFRVRTPSGATAFPVEVAVCTPDGDHVVEQVLESDDDRVVLPPGRYSVSLCRWSSAEHPSWEDVPNTRSVVRLGDGVVVRDGETTSIDVTWKPTAALALRIMVRGEAKEALAGSNAWLEPLGGERRPLVLQNRWGNYRRTTIYAGEWMFSNRLQKPGIYRLILEAKGFRTLTHEVRLIADDITRVELEMEREP